VALSNSAEFDDLQRSAVASSLAKIHLAEPRRLPTRVPVDHAPLGQYAGQYKALGGENIEIITENGALSILSPGQSRFDLVPESRVKFLVEGAEADSYFFHADDEGVVSGVTQHLSLFGYTRDAYKFFVKL